MSSGLKLGKAARAALRRGMNALAAAVRVTLGPKGRNVIVDKGHPAPFLTNDGVTIAREVDLEDLFEKAGAQLIYEVASKTNDAAGDGTTTATVLAQAMIELGMKAVARGANPVLLKEGIDRAARAVATRLGEMSRPVETDDEIENIAAISSGDREIGQIIARAIAKIGRGGVIKVDESTAFETGLEIVEGMQYDKGFVSPYMVSDRERMKIELEDVYLFITDQKITTVQEILPFLEEMTKINKPLLIIAEDFESEVISMLVVNKLRGALNAVATRAPGFGVQQREILQDIAVLFGGVYCSKELGMALSDMTVARLGRAAQAVITKDSTTLISENRKTPAVAARIAEIEAQINRAKNDYEISRCRERLSKLTGGIALIKVGAATDAELKHKKLKIEDAVNATRAAVEEGIIIGGGAAFVRIHHDLKKVLRAEEADVRRGINIVLKALLMPAYWICANAGFDGKKALKRYKNVDKDKGFDARAGKWVDMFTAGIIDPTKVARHAVLNAASIAALFITTEAAIVRNRDGKKLPDLLG
ncbi:MAG TPA: chaperonin GroEL [Acholeplasmataceae bacterium]|nr:chaperonin GroEL [Acholeplasmataceae bacterium]